MSKEQINRSDLLIEESKINDAEGILVLIQKAPDALLDISLKEIQSWIEERRSLIAKNGSGEIVGHQGMYYWPESNTVELRAAFVREEYRGKGLNTEMKKIMIAKSIEVYPGSRLIGFTEKASKSRGILVKLGFQEIPLEDTPEEYFSICPSGVCYRETGVSCGCKVFELDLNAKKRD